MNEMRNADAGRIARLHAVPQSRFTPSVIPGFTRALDVACIVIAALACSGLLPPGAQADHQIAAIVFYLFGYVIVANRSGLLETNSIMRPLIAVDRIVVSAFTCFSLFFSMMLAFDFSDTVSVQWLASSYAASCVLIIVARFLLAWMLRRFATQGMICANLVVLGTGEQSRQFIRRLGEAKPYFMRLVGVFAPDDDAPEEFEGQMVMGGVEDLLISVRASLVDDVVVAMPWNENRKVIAAIERLKELPVNVYLSSDLIGFNLAFRPGYGQFRQLPIFEVVQRPISGWNLAAKVISDYVIASAIMIVLSPLLLLIAALIKLDSPGPVFFMQKRLGFNNREFSIYKFRSMYHREIPEASVRQASRGDPRITRVGRFIRATSLDELPQLINVLNGTMSLVGPRPHALSHNEEYGRQIRGYFARHKVKPGITGWAQVNGLRGETEALEAMTARIQHDIYYAENWSLLFDFRIIIQTALVVFFQKSAY